MADKPLRWWNPLSVLRESSRLQEVKRSGVCPVCDHGMHRDGPCGTCGDRCPYPKSYDAAQDRFAEARADFGVTLRASIERLFSRGR